MFIVTLEYSFFNPTYVIILNKLGTEFSKNLQLSVKFLELLLYMLQLKLRK